MADSDPFSCFGSDNEEEDESPTENTHNASTTDHNRDPNCGVFSFHPNTEQSLLMHLQNNLSIQNKESNDELFVSEKVLAEIDNYCETRAWMMHVGPEKGIIIQDALEKQLDDFIKKSTLVGTHDKNVNKTKNFIALELGTYCGYGSIFLARKLHEYAKEHENVNIHLFTIEINPIFANIAKKIIKLAKLSDYISVLNSDLLMDGTTSDVAELLKDAISQHLMIDIHDKCCLDFVMIDHDKDNYLSDLKKLEKNGMIQRGTTVAADNVIFGKIDDYVSYMKALDKKGIVSTVTEESNVEYYAPDIERYKESKELFRDGVEITKYLKEPYPE